MCSWRLPRAAACRGHELGLAPRALLCSRISRYKCSDRAEAAMRDVCSSRATVGQLCIRYVAGNVLAGNSCRKSLIERCYRLS